LIDDFYAQIDRHPNARRVITGGREQVLRLKETLRGWLCDLFSGRYDRDYVDRRWTVGRKHIDVDLEQLYTSAALSRLRKGLVHALQENWPHDHATLVRTLESLNMLLDMDLAIIQDAYEDHYKVRLQQARIP
jgi:hypothetical protein